MPAKAATCIPDLGPRNPASGGGHPASLFGGSGVQAGLQSVWRILG